MDRQTIIDLLEKFLREHGDDLPDHLRKEIEDLLKKLKTEPDETLAAEILAKIIEKLGDKLPPGIRDFVKAYAEALRSGIKAGEFIRCRQYNTLREQGLDDETAARLAGLDPHNHSICRVRWDLDHMPLDPPAGPGPKPPTPGEWLGPMPKGPSWSEEDDPCCSKTADITPVVTIRNPVLTGDHRGTFFSGEVDISHECGILYYAVTATIGAATIGDGTKETFPRSSVDATSTNGGKNVTVTFNRFQVGLKTIPNILINVVAISKCMGRTQKSFPVP